MSEVPPVEHLYTSLCLVYAAIEFTAVERIWCIKDSQGHILALAFEGKCISNVWHSPDVGSFGGAFSHERGTPIAL